MKTYTQEQLDYIKLSNDAAESLEQDHLAAFEKGIMECQVPGCHSLATKKVKVGAWYSPFGYDYQAVDCPYHEYFCDKCYQEYLEENE